MKRVELQRIDPPADVMSAMHEQMKAERTRRATVTTAGGPARPTSPAPRASGRLRSSRAEAVKQQQILEAEGAAMAVRELAEAEKFRNIATAEGEAEAIRSVYGAIHDGNPSNDLIAIKYLDALAKIADGRATKIFLPVDTTNVMGSIAGHLRAVPLDRRPHPAATAVLNPPRSTVCVTDTGGDPSPVSVTQTGEW